MAHIKLLPHFELCPDGAEFETLKDESICEVSSKQRSGLTEWQKKNSGQGSMRLWTRKLFISLTSAKETQQIFMKKMMNNKTSYTSIEQELKQ